MHHPGTIITEMMAHIKLHIDGLLFYITELLCTTQEPCMNGATCTDILNDVMCDCVDGFTGNKCETGNSCS